MSPGIDSEGDVGNGTIYDLAWECAGLFDEYLSAPRLQSKLVAQSQRRFLSWVAFMGVFASQAVCLDTRLRYKPDVRGLVMVLLGVLERNIRRGAVPSRSSKAISTWIVTVTDLLN